MLAVPMQMCRLHVLLSPLLQCEDSGEGSFLKLGPHFSLAWWSYELLMHVCQLDCHLWFMVTFVFFWEWNNFFETCHSLRNKCSPVGACLLASTWFGTFYQFHSWTCHLKKVHILKLFKKSSILIYFYFWNLHSYSFFRK